MICFDFFFIIWKILHTFSSEAEKLGSEMSGCESTPSSTDLQVDFSEFPSTGRFIPDSQANPGSRVPRRRDGQPISFSGEVTHRLLYKDDYHTPF